MNSSGLERRVGRTTTHFHLSRLPLSGRLWDQLGRRGRNLEDESVREHPNLSNGWFSPTHEDDVVATPSAFHESLHSRNLQYL